MKCLRPVYSLYLLLYWRDFTEETKCVVLDHGYVARSGMKM